VLLSDLVRRLHPDLTLTFHQPLFGVGANDKGMPMVRALAGGMRLPVDEFHCTGICYGTFTGWVNNRTAGLAVTVEFGHRVPSWRIGRAARTVVEVGLTGPLPS
jgi:murein peptide amidase A